MKTKELKKVSIIIPIHNSAKTINVCIESIINQNYKNIECILIENGSNDNSFELCLEYSKKYNNIISVKNEQLGVSNARNKGLELSTGQIIGFCDADDFLEPNAIENIVKEFEQNSNIVAVFGAFYVGQKNNGQFKKTYVGLNDRTVSIQRAMQLTIINDSIMGSVWNKYYKSNVIKKSRFDPNLELCEDMHFNAKLLSEIISKDKVKIINTPLYCYMNNKNSVTHMNDFLFNKNNELKYIVALKKIVKDCILDKKTLALSKMKIACFCIDSLDHMDLNTKKKNILIQELKKNYLYLLSNFYENNWKWNLKRIYIGGRIILQNFKY